MWGSSVRVQEGGWRRERKVEVCGRERRGKGRLRRRRGGRRAWQKAWSGREGWGRDVYSCCVRALAADGQLTARLQDKLHSLAAVVCPPTSTRGSLAGVLPSLPLLLPPPLPPAANRHLHYRLCLVALRLECVFADRTAWRPTLWTIRRTHLLPSTGGNRVYLHLSVSASVCCSRTVTPPRSERCKVLIEVDVERDDH